MGATEGVSAIRGREEPPQATQQAGPYGGVRAIDTGYGFSYTSY